MSPGELALLFFNYYIAPYLNVLNTWFEKFHDFVYAAKGYFEKICWSIFDRLTNNGYDQLMLAKKIELFSGIENIQSADPSLRRRGIIRVLELGIMQGNLKDNFDFYPGKVRLIAVDPQDDYLRDLDRKLVKYSGIVLEQRLTGDGEDLGEVRTGSVDAVIATSVLCTSDDPSRILREIKRVLVQGGKYYFMEHVVSDRRNYLQRLQGAVEPFWVYWFGGCQLTADFGKTIGQAGFVRTNIKRFVTPIAIFKFYRIFFSHYIFGKARK